MYKKTILSTTLGFFIMQFLFPYIQGQSQIHNYKTIIIFTGPIRLSVGHNYWIKFQIPQNATSAYVKGYVSSSGSIVNTVTLKLYEADKCPPTDLKGYMDFNKCSSPLLSGDYLQAEQILKYISHAGNFYLVFENNSPLFDKTISGNLRIEYLDK
jgi:hypothetical protein